MRAILIKIKADLINCRTNTLLVMFTIAASAALLALTVIALSSMTDPYDRVFNQLNGAHLWLYFNRALTRKSDLTRIEQMPEVSASSGLVTSQAARIELHPGEKVLVSVRSMSVQPPLVNGLLISAGRALADQDARPGARGVLLDKLLAEQYRVKVGDTVHIRTANGDQPLTVVGLAFNPTWDIYRTTQLPYVYTLTKTFDSLFPDPAAWDWSLGLRLSDPQAVDTTRALAEKLVHKKAITGHTDWREVRDAYVFGVQLNALLLTAFGLLALWASALIITNSISGVVLSQFRDIGILKSIGFTGSDIAWVYLGQNLLVGAVAGALGISAAVLLAPLPLANMAASLNTTPRSAFDPFMLLVVWLAVQVVVIFATAWPAWRGMKVNIIRAISTGYELASPKPSMLARLAKWTHLPTPVVMGVKDAFAQRGRALLTLASLMVGVISLVFNLVLNNVIDDYLRDPSQLGIVYDAWIERATVGGTTTGVSDQTARVILKSAPGVTAFYAHATALVKTADMREFMLRGEEGDLSRFPFLLEAGRIINPNVPGEAMIGVGLQNWLGLHLGDEITLRIGEKDRPLKLRLVGVYREPSDSGQMAITGLRTLHDAGAPLDPDTYYLRLAPGANIAGLRAYLKNRSRDNLTLSTLNATPDSLVHFRIAMLALSAVLVALAMASVFNSAVLDVRERLSEVGVFKSLGMTPAQILAMVLASGGTLGVLAGILGAPLGVILVQVTLSALGQYTGFGSFNLEPKWLTLLVPALLAILVSLVGSALPAWWAARMKVVEVFRYE
jgi:putative ABC transport system permease protein